MNKRFYALAAVAVLLAAFLAACAPAGNPTAAAPSDAGNAVAVEMAPVCQGANTCQVPTAELNRIECVNKIPYTNVLVEPGTAFEVLDRSGDFTCNDSGTVVDGKTVITCFGKELNSFDLKLTNGACGGAKLEKGTGRCQEGFGLDSAQQCCAPLGGDASGSVVVTVDLGPCPLPH